ncbi:MAG: hypothetical protein HY681_01010 [Chloroflexi bacterium]|nr:hypothetical protein [Chloroflexota bacterium]
MVRRHGIPAAAGAIAALLALVFLLGATASAQTAGVEVSGRLVNGTAGGPAPAEVTVLLQALSEGAPLESRLATSDEEGRFSFGIIPSGATNYFISATYLNVPYGVELKPEDDLAAVSLPVYETTSDMSALSLPTSSMLVIGAEPETGRVAFMELSQVRNSSDRTFVPDQASGGMNFLRMPLPPGAGDLEVQTELPEGQAIQVDRGFGMTSPVPPGQHGVAYSYTAPYDGGAFEASRTFLLGVGLFRVLVPEELGKVTAANLQVKGATNIGGASFWLLEGENIPPGGTASYGITGLPRLGLTEQVQTALGGDVSVLAGPGIVVAGLMALLAFGLWRRAPQAQAALAKVPDDRRGLLRAVALLDDQFERGEIDRDAYESRRGLLMGRLLSLARAEEAGA